MIGSFLTRSLALILGYAYPAYECFKTVELNKPDIDQLLFWCQYWILVAALTVFERVGDNFISWYWLPMYSEAKLAFFVYLWYPKTKGTTYVYETFLRPYVAKHETEIDRNLLELRTRSGDFAVLYFQKAANYGQTRVFEILQYVASQAPTQQPRNHPVQQRQPPQQIRQTSSTTTAREPTDQPKQPKSIPSSPTRSQHQETSKAGASSSESVAKLPSSSGQPSQPNPAAVSHQAPTAAGEKEASQSVVADANGKENQKDDTNPPVQGAPIQEALRITRARSRKRTGATAIGPSAP